MNFLERIVKGDAGLYVSRPVLNGDAWVKWATKFGVPNPVPAEQMHVTVIASRKAVQTKPQVGSYQIFADMGQITRLGLDGSVLVFAWCCDWLLMDRYCQLLGFGATSDWPDFRPHISLSYDAAGFVLPPEALKEMPPSFLLGDEIHAPFTKPAQSEIAKSLGAGEAVRLESLAAPAAAAALAKGAKDGWDKLDAYDRQTLALIAAEQPVLKTALEKLDGKVAFLTAEPEPRPTGIIKTVEELRMVYGFASVSLTKSGAVVDSHKHLITTKAIRNLVHGLIKGDRAGKFDHGGGKRTDIIEGLVFDADIWKALGSYLEDIGEITPEQGEVFKSLKFEGALLGFHCADDKVWEMAQSVDFELSIGAEEGLLQEINHAGA